MQDDDRDHQRDESGGEDALGPGVEQFQRAALDAVRAMRAMLDAAESVLADPAAIESVVHTLTSMARTAGETVVGFAAGAGRSGRAPGSGDTSPDDDDGDGGFERIPVD